MAEYTPPMQRLRDEYVEMRAEHFGFSDLYGAEFDRALAAHDEAVRAEEREACAQVAESQHDVGWNPGVALMTARFPDEGGRVAAAIRARGKEQK